MRAAIKYIMKALVILFMLVTALSAQDPFKYNHPELNWESFETEHFFIHFHNGTERTAKLVGKIAEDIHEPLTDLYDYSPSGKIHFIIRDTDDYSNGGAYFFDNKVEIWAQNLDYVMRGTRNWLRDVVTHEYAHMISIQKSIKFSRTVPYGFFQYFNYEPERRKDVVRGFPNTIVSYPISSITIPVWFAEGVAQYQATGARYDYRDPNREMVLRDRIIQDKMLSYNEMGVFGKDSHGNESAYNLGFAFVAYICDRFGEDVLEKITKECGDISVFTFSGALENATGVSGKDLYQDWIEGLQRDYRSKLQTIISNEIKGTAIETEGFSNLHPIWSPDGEKIYYITNKGSDSWGQSYLVQYDVVKDKKKNINLSGISSSLSISPDGKFILFAAHRSEALTGSKYRDLFIYDLDDRRTTRLTKRMRAKNPSWSRDGKKIAFVTENNGVNNLFLYSIDDINSGSWNEYYVNPENGLIVDETLDNQNSRLVEVKGGRISLLQEFPDGRQVYHPRWSSDDKKLVMGTATDYGRDIAIFDFDDRSFNIKFSGKEELRYPVFHPEKNELYYTSSETGIYNIYKMNLDNGTAELVTNVTGGAVMAAVNQKGEIVYSCYDDIGYHIYTIKDPVSIEPRHAIYDDNYLAKVPDKNFDDSQLPDWQAKPYRQHFTGLHIMPRLLIDYGTVKPGFYLFATDVLDKMTFIAGADINTNFDYDLYGVFEFREFLPTLFIEAYNLSQNITDSLAVRTGRDYEIIDQDINFDLTEIQAGLRFYLPEQIQWRFSYIMSLYHAKLQWFDPFANDILSFRYRYLNGKALQVRAQADHIKYDKNHHINPSGGRFVQFKYTWESNDFLVDFDTGKNVGLEVYENYTFNRFELDWEEYFSAPIFKDHSFSVRLQAGYIDRPVDDFFYLWAGGLLGMRGYSYFSLGGTKKFISSFTYRFPVLENIDLQLWNLYFDKLYMGVFYDWGNAWDEEGIYPDKFKKDIGIQLRLNVFSNHLFPTRVFWEAVYPLDDVERYNVFYDNEWRYYFGILFEFDIRERHGPRVSHRRR